MLPDESQRASGMLLWHYATASSEGGGWREPVRQSNLRVLALPQVHAPWLDRFVLPCTKRRQARMLRRLSLPFEETGDAEVGGSSAMTVRPSAFDG